MTLSTTMIEQLFPKKPFFKIHEFKGSLAKQEQLADGLQVVVRYPLTREGEIRGKVVGDRDAFKKIERLFKAPGPLWTLKSQEHEDVRWQIRSDQVLVPMISDQGWPSDYGEGMATVVADLRLEDVFLTESFGTQRGTQDRQLSFFLAGPRELWGILQLRTLSYTGEVEIDVRNARVELDEPFPYEIEVRPVYFYDETSRPDRFEVTTNTLALLLKTDKSLDELPTEDFLSSGKEFADDLTLLVSFLSRRWVEWFRYELSTSESIRTYVRRTRSCSTNRLNWEDGLMEHHKCRDFLKTGLRNLRELRKAGFNLLMPIVYFVSANEKRYLEEQFTTFFLSLERIKDMFARQEGLLYNLPEEDFKKLRPAVSAVIKETVPSSKPRKVMNRKIRELNRPPLAYVLEKLFSRYDVEWRDLYPKGSDLTLVATRNDLFHSSQALNMDLVVRERDRLQALLERILLRMLGWDDISRSPTDSLKQWLTAPMESEPKRKKGN